MSNRNFMTNDTETETDLPADPDAGAEVDTRGLVIATPGEHVLIQADLPISNTESRPLSACADKDGVVRNEDGEAYSTEVYDVVARDPEESDQQTQSE
jgi:hypothetical protein